MADVRLSKADPMGVIISLNSDIITELKNQRSALLSALETLILFTKPTKSNAAALANAHRVIQELKP